MPETANHNNEREFFLTRRESLIAERIIYEDKMRDFVVGKLLTTEETGRKQAVKSMEDTLRISMPPSYELFQYASKSEIENGTRMRWEVFRDRVKFYEGIIAHIVQQLAVENLEAGGKQKFVDLNFEIGSNAKPIVKQESGTEWAEADGYQNYVQKLTKLLIHYGLGEKQSNLKITRTIVNEWSKKGREGNVDPTTEVDEVRSKVYSDVVLVLLKDKKVAEAYEAKEIPEIKLTEGLKQVRESLFKIDSELADVVHHLPVKRGGD